MSILNTRDILETIQMITDENLDVRTVTMGISLLDCIDPDPARACEKIYNKITTKAANLVPVVEKISADYGIPIVNKRISVTPIAMLLGAAPEADPVDYAKALDKAAKAVGVNFIGGFGALVHKGFSAGDERLIEAIPRALAETDVVCSSVNIGSTKSGLNMDAIARMGRVVRKAAELTADNQCMGAAKLVVFCNAPEDNPFMAGAFHGPGEPDCVVHVGVSGPGAVRAALAKLPKDAPLDQVAELIKRTAFKITRMGQPVAGAHPRHRGQCGQHPGRDGAGKLRLLRNHRRPGPFERRGEKRRRDGLEPCGRAVRRVHPGKRGRRDDPGGRTGQPVPGKAGGHDRRVQRGH